ncbi:MAG: hypothetical protein AB7S50_03920 [Bacteroidales bacterium]
MKNSRLILLTLVLSVAIVNFGCKCSRSDSMQDQEVIDNSDSTSFSQDNEEVLIPAPSEVLEIILVSDLKFNSLLLAKPTIDKNVILVKHKSLIMGVYVADFAYASMFNQHDVGAQYFNSIQTLTEDLGIDAILKDSYYTRFETNHSNYDSLDLIFKDFSLNVYNSIVQTGNKELLSLIAIGSVVELIHIGLDAVKGDGNNEELIYKAFEQKAIFENFYSNFILINKDKKELQKLIVDLDKLYDFFKTRIYSDEHVDIVKDKDDHFIVKSNLKSDIDKTDLVELSKIIEDIRNKILVMKY